MCTLSFPTFQAMRTQQTTLPCVLMQAVLLSVHTFFDALGGEEIRKRGAREDKPLRMVKTVLHELCKLKVGGCGEWGL